MLGWIKRIGLLAETVYNIALIVVEFFAVHIVPLVKFVYDYMSTNGGFNFPTALATVAGVCAIVMVVRLLWNAGRGAGA